MIYEKKRMNILQMVAFKLFEGCSDDAITNTEMKTVRNLNVCLKQGSKEDSYDYCNNIIDKIKCKNDLSTQNPVKMTVN